MKEYTIKQASEILEVSTSTIRRRIKSGEYAAEKKNSPYGEQYFIPAKEIDQAVMENESVNISQVNKPVDKEEFINAMVEATEGKYKALFEGIADNLSDKIDKQNELLKDYKEQLEEQNSKLDDQKELINQLSEQLEDIKKQNKEKADKSFIDKIKKLFK
jgi:excisionase family DNA binding protein